MLFLKRLNHDFITVLVDLFSAAVVKEMYASTLGSGI